MLKKLSVLVFVGVLGASEASAATVQVWSGWMNLTPCSRVEWRNNGPFGLPSPTVRTGPQELHGSITIEVPTTTGQALAAIERKARTCGATAAAAAGVSALLTSGSAGPPAFTSRFNAWMANMWVHDFYNINLSTRTVCRY